MSIQIYRNRALGLAVASLILAGGAVMAAEPISEVTISASRESKVVVGRNYTGAPIEEVTLTRRVGYSDLDLKTKAGADALDKRVAEAAEATCAELDKQYPLLPNTSADCAKTANANAMVQVKAAIAAAAKRP
jgi:UrcA family protein